MTRKTRVGAVVSSTMAVAAFVLALAGCTSISTVAPITTSPTVAAPAVIGPAKPTPGVFNAALAYQSAWHVEAKSTYVNGSADVCDLNVGISIEDAAALANPDTSVPVFGFVLLHSGELSYGTVWPTAVPGTGISAGTGKVAITYDDSGLPTIGHGTATLTWHDAAQKPVLSKRHDMVTVTFTKESRADHCQ